jgi:zinc protease
MSVTPAGLNPVRHVIANGVTVLAKQSPVTPAVTIHLSAHAGAVSDPPDLPGLAYFLSRMIDRGTSAMTADEIAETLEGRGVSLATSVTRHALSLVSTCLVEDFAAVLRIMAECLMRPVFPEAEMTTRRGEMITFIRQDEDSPASVASHGLMETLFGSGHPYGRRPRGTVTAAERIDRPALVQFHAHTVVPRAVVATIVGDLDPAAATAACEEVFGAWTGPSPAPLQLPAPTPPAARRARVIPMMNKAQTDIAYGFVSVARADPEYYACWLMNNVLGEYSLGGRLGDSIRERQGMAYYVVSSLDANVIAGPLAIHAGVSAANVERTIAAIDHEVASLAANGPTDKELEESKQYLVGSLPRTLETNASIAAFLQGVEFFDLGLDYDVRLPGLLRAVSRDEVHAAARRVLDPSRAAVVVAGPYTGPAA